MGPIKFRSQGYKLTDTPFAGRVQIPSGIDIQQASIASISYTVVENIGPQAGTQTGQGTPAVAASVFNALVPPAVDPGWNEDNTGYNFKYTIPGAQFPDSGDYEVCFLFQPAGGGSAIPLQFIHHAFDY